VTGLIRIFGTCVVTALGAGIVLPPASARAADARDVAPPASGDVGSWVDQKVAACAPKPEERRFDQTGWLTDIRSALALAKQHNRPVFLFTHDGRMALGRC
jgi:hypothetical protein